MSRARRKLAALSHSARCIALMLVLLWPALLPCGSPVVAH